MKKKIIGTKERPRLYVFKSNKHIYTQLINDTSNHIIASSSSLSIEIREHFKISINCKIAEIVGRNMAKKSKEKGISHIVFDRGKKIYHGKIQAIAKSLREEGIIF